MESRFWSKVDKTDTCWNWTGAKTGFGHGRFKVNGRLESPHRIAWSLVNGPIPAGKWVLHSCDNPACCNPDHLHLGNRSDNSRECYQRGRMPHFDQGRKMFGEGNPSFKLSDDTVAEIRRRAAAGESGYSLAKIYNINKGHVYDLINNKYRPMKGAA